MTSGYFLIYKVSFFIKGLIGLGNIVVFLFIGSNIYYFIRNSRLISAVINYSVRSFDKSVLIYTCECSQRVDKTDVRTFGSLYRAHSSVMRMVNVSNFETGSFSWKTSGTERWKTTFVSKFSQRVVLIHELRKLWTAEEFFYGSRYGSYINKRLRSSIFHVLDSHTFTYYSLHSRKTYAELVL